MNERLFITLPSSLLLWMVALLSLAFTLNREVDMPVTGRNMVTVRFITQSAPPAPTVIKTKTPAPQKKPVKKKSAASHSVPQQHLSEARSDNHGAVILYQPLPKIPDDLRMEAFRTFAVARFHVATDGSATVELVTPCQNPRLNRILMDTLRTWRFKSATQGGKPVASAFTIRVHFTVD
jgi:periplasmic protein TonB